MVRVEVLRNTGGLLRKAGMIDFHGFHVREADGLIRAELNPTYEATRLPIRMHGGTDVPTTLPLEITRQLIGGRLSGRIEEFEWQAVA